MANNLQDEFEMGRIPLRPLPYEYKSKAYTQELMIDISRSNPDEEPSMHIYVTDSVDRTKIYDLSAKIIEESFSGKDIKISIDGIQEPLNLQEILSYIYLRFIKMDNPSGFDITRDISEITNQSSKGVLLKDINDNTVFPVTRSDVIFDIHGKSLQERLDNISRVAFNNDYIKVSFTDQNVFNIVYPFANYFDNGNYMQLMIGTTIIDKSRYHIDEITSSDGNKYGCNIVFYNDTFEEDRRIDILYIYNTTNLTSTESNTIDGHIITNNSININKIDSVTNSYLINSQDTLPSSSAVYNMYKDLSDIITQSGNKSAFCKDLTPDATGFITINVANDEIVLSDHYIICTIPIENIKDKNVELTVTSLNNLIDRESINSKYNLIFNDKLSSGKILKLLINTNDCIILNVYDFKFNCTRYIYYSSTGNELDIDWSKLDYNDNGILEVYRNGIRLFKDLDYTLDIPNRILKLFVKTSEADRIIFECKYLTN